jgi:hypothetical protein
VVLGRRVKQMAVQSSRILFRIYYFTNRSGVYNCADSDSGFRESNNVVALLLDECNDPVMVASRSLPPLVRGRGLVNVQSERLRTTAWAFATKAFAALLSKCFLALNICIIVAVGPTRSRSNQLDTGNKQEHSHDRAQGALRNATGK